VTVNIICINNIELPVHRKYSPSSQQRVCASDYFKLGVSTFWTFDRALYCKYEIFLKAIYGTKNIAD